MTRHIITHGGHASDPLLLCLHGIGSCADAFAPQAPLASQCGRHVLAWDAPGYRHSPDPDEPFTLDDWADAAAAVITSFKSQADVLGVSWGGVTATRLALRHPSLVRSLILADSSVGSGTTEEGAEAMRGRANAVVELGIEAFGTSRAPLLFGSTATADVVQEAAQMMIDSVRMPVYEWACASLAEADHTAQLGDIAAPTLVVVGSEDTITPPARSQALADGIPNAELATIERAGHLANQERPEAFNAVVADFLNNHAPPGASG